MSRMYPSILNRLPPSSNLMNSVKGPVSSARGNIGPCNRASGGCCNERNWLGGASVLCPGGHPMWDGRWRPKLCVTKGSARGTAYGHTGGNSVRRVGLALQGCSPRASGQTLRGMNVGSSWICGGAAGPWRTKKFCHHVV